MKRTGITRVSLTLPSAFLVNRVRCCSTLDLPTGAIKPATRFELVQHGSRYEFDREANDNRIEPARRFRPTVIGIGNAGFDIGVAQFVQAAHGGGCRVYV